MDAEKRTRLQAAYVAVRDSLNDVGHAWITNRGTVNVRGVLRMRILLEPVYTPLTSAALILALAKHDIRPRTVRPKAGVDLRVIHQPTGVEVDVTLAPKLSAATKRYLDKLLGKGWLAKGPPERR